MDDIRWAFERILSHEISLLKTQLTHARKCSVLGSIHSGTGILMPCRDCSDTNKNWLRPPTSASTLPASVGRVSVAAND